ncbi:MAG TPA: histone deacetylase family protein [Hyphomicrobiales bacterium]|nr:histone deacetylase family protein [Rhodobiaceae bacterium]HXK54397.1 histone deacetylase family protein [Hyphomicrobiales bacterium]
MTTLLLTHADCLAHEVPPGHPERPDRLRAVLGALEGDDFAALVREEAPLGTLDHARLAHDPRHVAHIRDSAPKSDFAGLDPDTVMSPKSLDAALRAIGAVIRAVDQVVAGKADNAFCAVRPPGHHAERGRAMGFCLFNNIAIGALHARRAHGLARVAVVDFDVHHGNGTQDIFREDETLFYGSTHQMPLYPGTGAAAERGVGNIFNAPLAPGAGSLQFREAMERVILPALDAFAPELVMVSAGFDAHMRDPLANLALSEDDYAWASERLLEAARAHAGGRLVSALEGGYDLEALKGSARAHVGALLAA